MSISSFGQAPRVATNCFKTNASTVNSTVVNPVLVTASGLVFPGYIGSGIGLAAGVNNTGQDVSKSFVAQTTGSIYTSFLVNATLNSGIGGYFFHYYDPLSSNAFRAKIFIKPVTGKMQIGFSFNSSFAQDSLPNSLLNFGETYLFVVKYTIVDGPTNDNVSLYIFKTGDDLGTEPIKPTIGPLAATYLTPSDINLTVGPDIIPAGIALRQFETAQRITVDGFRVKTKWQLTADDPSEIHSVNADPLQFYPNPVSNGCIHFANPTNELKQIEIFDLVGRKVLERNTLLNDIDLGSLKRGVYTLKVQVGDKITSAKLVLK